MKIAFAVEHFDARRGGAERQVWRFAEWLLARGHALTVYAADAPCPLANARIVVWPDARRFLSLRARLFGFSDWLGRCLRDDPPDVTLGFNHAWPGDILTLHGGVHRAFERFNAQSASLPLARHLKQTFYLLHPKYRALRDNETRQFGDPNRRFVAVSQRVADDMLRYYPSVAGRVHVVHPGIDFPSITPSEQAALRAQMRKNMGVTDETRVFLFVSHNYRLKGLHALLEALPLLRRKLNADFALWVVGRGHTAPFEGIVRRHDLARHVRFAGEAASVNGFYAAADALAHPSYYDSFGGVCLEAMAYGLPVVVSRNCGVAELIPDGLAGRVIDIPCPPEILADALAQAVGPDIRRQAAQNNPVIARDHPVERHFQQVELLLPALK